MSTIPPLPHVVCATGRPTCSHTHSHTHTHELQHTRSHTPLRGRRATFAPTVSCPTQEYAPCVLAHNEDDHLARREIVSPLAYFPLEARRRTHEHAEKVSALPALCRSVPLFLDVSLHDGRQNAVAEPTEYM